MVARVRKCLIVTTAIVIASTASVPFAAGATYTGHFSDSAGSVSFKTVVKGGAIEKVKQFAWDGVPVFCREGGSTTSSDQFGQAMGVRRKTGKFQGTLTDASGGRFVVVGRFKKHNHGRALGDFKIRTATIDPTHTGCDAGVILWSAH